MEQVVVSSDFQIVLPESIVKNMSIRPGQRFHVIQYDGRIELFPVRSMNAMRGFLKGIDTSIPRE